MSENKIIWEKWIDPFGQNLDEMRWNNYDESLDPDGIEYVEEEVAEHMPPIKVIASPMGLIPYNEYTASSNIFNFWVGHTNFDITENVSDIIEQVPGVEILDIFTRYRFRIGIGKCFNDRDTMNEISTQLGDD